MQKATAIEAYNEIRKNGLLKGLRFQVYDYIASAGPVTLNNIIAAIAKPGSNTGAISGRMSELERARVIEVCGTSQADTGHKVSLYRTTCNLPEKLERAETKAQAIDRLTKRVQELETKLAQVQPGLFELA